MFIEAPKIKQETISIYVKGMDDNVWEPRDEVFDAEETALEDEGDDAKNFLKNQKNCTRPVTSCTRMGSGTL